MEGLEEGVTGLSFRPATDQSLVADPVFQVFYSALPSECEDGRWKSLVASQQYPEPRLILANAESVAYIAKTEPGRQIDYKQTRADLETAQDDIQHGMEAKAQMVRTCNDLLNAHIDYVRAATNVMVYKMYDKMIERFYGGIPDKQFQLFVTSNIPPDMKFSWPDYDTTKGSNTSKLAASQVHLRTCTNRITSLKSSPTTRAFFAKLKTALENYHTRIRQGEAQQKSDLESQAILDRHMAKQARELLASRKRAIERRNYAMERARTERYWELKDNGVNSVHQLGEATRVELSDSFINALAALQKKDIESMEDNDEDYYEQQEGEDEEAYVEPMPLEGWLPPPLDGIILPKGMVNIAGGVGTYLQDI